MNKLIAALLLLASAACFAETEEMVQVTGEHDREKMLNMFISENIPHKVVNEIQIYYPVSYREKVKRIQERVWGPVDSSKRGVSVNKDVAPVLAAELVKKGVPFSVNHNEGKSIFSWETYYDKSAMGVVHDVVP